MAHRWWHPWGDPAGTEQTEAIIIGAPPADASNDDEPPASIAYAGPHGGGVEMRIQPRITVPNLTPKQQMEQNFVDYVKKYPSDYPTERAHADELYGDPRLEGFLSQALKMVEHSLTPDAMPAGGVHRGVVLSLAGADWRTASSLDPQASSNSTTRKYQLAGFTLTCYPFHPVADTICTPRQAATLDPKALQNLPKVHGIWKHGMTMPVLGDVIKFQYKAMDYFNADFVDIVPGQNMVHMLQTSGDVEKLAEKFAKNRFDQIKVSDLKKASKEEVRQCADEYDLKKKTMIGIIHRHGEVGSLWSNQSTYFKKMDSRLIPYAKCFLWQCWKEHGITIRFTSAYRTAGEQRALRIRYLTKERDAQGNIRQPLIAGTSYATKKEYMPICTPEVAAAAEGVGLPAGVVCSLRDSGLIATPYPDGSWHLSGLAFDFKAYTPDGTVLRKNSARKDWYSQGAALIRIGQRLGLRWLGPGDPIHFDMRDLISLSDMRASMLNPTVGGA